MTPECHVLWLGNYTVVLSTCAAVNILKYCSCMILYLPPSFSHSGSYSL